MIKILIVEDNLYKLGSIKKLLTEDLMIESKDVHVAENIKEAKRMLVSNVYDLLILDLVLPLESGDSPSPIKGIGFLKDLETNTNLLLPIHIIGLTEFSELKEQYGKDFERYVWYLINYNATEINWQDTLKQKVYHLVNTKKRFVEHLQNKPLFDIAIITALNKPEFEKIFELPVEWQSFYIDGDPTCYYRTIMKKNERFVNVVAACAEQMGMTATASLTTKMIYHFKPKYFMMGGICAGLKEKEVNYGDIIIAEQSWDYGSGKIKEVKDSDNNNSQILFEPDPRPIQLDASLKAKVNSLLRNSSILYLIYEGCKYAKPKDIRLKAEIGPVASGSYVISSKSKLDEIKAGQRKLLGVEMESYGLYYACQNSKDAPVKAIMIKSVSDYGDSTKNDTYHDYSSYTSIYFIYHLILEELI